MPSQSSSMQTITYQSGRMTGRSVLSSAASKASKKSRNAKTPAYVIDRMFKAVDWNRRKELVAIFRRVAWSIVGRIRVDKIVQRFTNMMNDQDESDKNWVAALKTKEKPFVLTSSVRTSDPNWKLKFLEPHLHVRPVKPSTAPAGATGPTAAPGKLPEKGGKGAAATTNDKEKAAAAPAQAPAQAVAPPPPAYVIKDLPKVDFLTFVNQSGPFEELEFLSRTSGISSTISMINKIYDDNCSDFIIGRGIYNNYKEKANEKTVEMMTTLCANLPKTHVIPHVAIPVVNDTNKTVEDVQSQKMPKKK